MFAELPKEPRVKSPFLSNLRMPPVPQIKPLAEILSDHERSRSAGTVFRTVMEQVRDFEDTLDDKHEVALHLVTFGQSLTIRVTEVGFIEPAIIIFIGRNDEDEEVRLVQHIHQLNFLLLRATRLHPESPKEPIGFSHEGDAAGERD